MASKFQSAGFNRPQEEGGGPVTPITAPQVKTLYESNEDTNPFDDAAKQKLTNLPSAEELLSGFGGKVDKVAGSSLMTTAQAGKLAELPTADELLSELGSKVNASALGSAAYLPANDFATAAQGQSADVALGLAQTAVQKVTGSTLMTTAQAEKLAGIDTGATKNATDAQLRDRATHTGEQPISSVTGLQTALDGKVATSDSKLTNAREWTAATVEQAEAEARTATTRRAWTAQRVGQAIAAWWATTGTAFGRAVVSWADAVAGRTALGLGTAATATLTTSTTDREVGRVLRVGDGGLQINLYSARLTTGAGSPRATKIAVVAGQGPDLGDGVAFVVASAGNVGILEPRHIHLVSVTQRGLGHVSAKVILLSGGSSGEVTFYTQKIDNTTYEVWMAEPPWAAPCTLTCLFGGARQGTQIGSLATASAVPAGAVPVTVTRNLDGANTTVDSNGFLKTASPIIKLHSSHIETNSEDVPAFERIDAGHYRLTGCNGLRLDDGWYIETPHDRNGNKYFNVEWEQSSEPETDAGILEEPANVTLTVRCYERVWNPQTGTYDNGDPIDIRYGRWIDLRMNEVRQPEPELEVPEDPESP